MWRRPKTVLRHCFNLNCHYDTIWSFLGVIARTNVNVHNIRKLQFLLYSTFL